MADKIILNEKEYQVSEPDLPFLITYVEKAGGSHFSVSMIADLFLQGKKILFLTAYPMAKDNFFEQIKGYESKTAYITNVSQLDSNIPGIILESGNEELFLKATKKLSDIDERIILIKNMEVFGQAVFDICLKYQKLILSGNIDKCIAKKQIRQKKFNTIVAFTKPEIDLGIKIPALEKYVGYWWSKDKEGQAKLKINN